MHRAIADALCMSTVSRTDIATAATLCALPGSREALAAHPSLRFDSARTRRAAALHAHPERVFATGADRAALLQFLMEHRRSNDLPGAHRQAFDRLRGLLVRCMVDDPSTQDVLIIFLVWFRASTEIEQLLADALRAVSLDAFVKPRPHVIRAFARELKVLF